MPHPNKAARLLQEKIKTMSLASEAAFLDDSKDQQAKGQMSSFRQWSDAPLIDPPGK